MARCAMGGKWRDRERERYLLDGANLFLALQWFFAELALFKVIAYLYAGLELRAVHSDESGICLSSHKVNENVLEGLKSLLYIIREVIELRRFREQGCACRLHAVTTVQVSGRGCIERGGGRNSSNPKKPGSMERLERWDGPQNHRKRWTHGCCIAGFPKNPACTPAVNPNRPDCVA